MPRVVVTGNFDGCHLGHRALAQRVLAIATEQNLEPLAITFEPHTRHVLRGEGTPKLLTDLPEKSAILEDWGLPMAVLPFTPELSRLPFQDYVRTILVRQFQAEAWVLGHDHSFGHRAQGRFEQVQASFPALALHQISAVLVEGAPVSSSRIRSALEIGDIATANALLGYAYGVRGQVVHGAARGRQLGFPTANLQASPHKLLPAQGVYAGWAQIEGEVGEWRAIANFGHKPTFGGGATTTEVHLLDFQGDLYGKNLGMKLNLRLRDEMKFTQVSDLIRQITLDAERARVILDGRDQ